MRLLAVDDDSVILELLEVFLTSIGYDDVEYVTSGAEALKTIKTSRTPFDCILLDIQMPGMTGIELIPQVRSLDDYLFTPIIMLTAMLDRNWIAEAFVAGAWDYVSKPFELYELETRLHAAELRLSETMRFYARPDQAPAQLEVPAQRQIALQRPRDFEAVSHSGLILEDAFENCVLRIRGEVGSDLRILMIEMDGFNNRLCSLSEEKRARYPAEMAKQLSDALSSKQAIVTYRGNGQFMALSYAFENSDVENLEQLVQKAARRTDKMVFGRRDGATACRTALARASDVPCGSDPLRIIHVAQERLLVT
jgi:DNA-binding response OmpR family regulator